MADYKAIKGWTIQTVSSDPSNPIKGQVWYNSTLGKLKGAKLQAGSWASGNDSNTSAFGRGCFGIQTAAVMYGGAPYTANSETYDGSSWTEGSNLNQPRAYCGGAGTATAGIAITGYNGTDNPNGVYSICETYDGSSWTEVGDTNTARNSVQSVGATNTAALCVGGAALPGSNYDIVETWDGSSWTETGDLNSGRQYGGGSGTSTAGLIMGGGNPRVAVCESYDGSSWTEVGDINTARSQNGASHAGTQTAALTHGGTTSAPTRTNATESWDGSSWTEENNLNTTRGTHMSTGTSTSAFAGAGRSAPTTRSVATEEWDVGQNVKVITD